MKHAQSQTLQPASDTALQLRILATCRLHNALTEHYIEARKFYVNLSVTEQHKLAGELALRLGMIEAVDCRARLLVHLGQIHGDLSHQITDQISTASATPELSGQLTGEPAQSQFIECLGEEEIYQGFKG